MWKILWELTTQTSYYVLLSQICSPMWRPFCVPVIIWCHLNAETKSETHFFHLLISRVRIGAVSMHGGAEINSFWPGSSGAVTLCVAACGMVLTDLEALVQEQETVCQCGPRVFLLHPNTPDFTDEFLFSLWTRVNQWSLRMCLVELKPCTVAHGCLTLL